MDMDTLKFSVGFSTCMNHRESTCESILNMANIFISMRFYLWKSCILFQDEEDYRLKMYDDRALKLKKVGFRLDIIIVEPRISS